MRIKREERSRQLADLIYKNYSIKSAEDIENAMKDVFGPLFESILNAEMTALQG